MEVTDELLEAATFADVDRAIGKFRWLWPGWIPGGTFSLITGERGVGKTRLLLDLVRRMYRSLPWPDGSPPTLAPKTKTLWLASDLRHGDILAALPKLGVPDSTVVFVNGPAMEGSRYLDTVAERHDLGRLIRKHSPGMVVIDTILKASRSVIYRPEVAYEFYGELIALAQQERTAIVATCMLDKEGTPLGRAGSSARAILHVESRIGDPESTRHVRIVQSTVPYPSPLVATLTSAGVEYDRVLTPP